ncbi:MAG TPA: GGDEF domain-containing phosphodiesterase, partial [Allocoleopsis sp.]
DLIHPQELEQTVCRLLQLLADPYNLDESDVQPQVSVGIARFADPEGPLEDLLDGAMQAMRQAQREGGNRFIYYHDSSLQLPLTEVNLMRALQQGELQLYYQPQIHLITGKIIGTEVLLRWPHPELGMLLPASFLPLAQTTGTMVALGEWVIQTACEQLRQWQEQIHLSLKVAVNLSGLELSQPNLVEKVHLALQKTGLDPHLLVLEMGEMSLMQQQDALVKQLHRFKRMGVQICIDDFGTGFSSFSALRKFPVNLLKIDQRFMEDIPGDASSVAIARAIIAMAQSLQVKVIAEGVETEEQLAFLKQTGCYAVQGYLFSPPIAAAEFGKLLACNPRL